MRRLVMAVIAAGVLAACGGGGGGGSESSWLSFEPTSLSATVFEGESIGLSVIGTASAEPNAQVYIGAFVDGTFFDPGSIRMEGLPGLAEKLSANTRPTLSVGTHESDIEVRACRDDPVACNQPYNLSPWHIPVVLQVEPDPGNPMSPLNGDFSGGTTGWSISAASGTNVELAVADGELFVDSTNGGTELRDVKVSYSPGINLEQGKTYRLTFDAHADIDRLIEVHVNENGRDLDGDGFTDTTYNFPWVLTVRTTKENLQTDITMLTTNRAATITFFLGGVPSASGFWIDNVSVTELVTK